MEAGADGVERDVGGLAHDVVGLWHCSRLLGLLGVVGGVVGELKMDSGVGGKGDEGGDGGEPSSGQSIPMSMRVSVGGGGEGGEASSGPASPEPTSCSFAASELNSGELASPELTSFHGTGSGCGKDGEDGGGCDETPEMC